MILQKIILGISLAAPIGPVSVEVIRRGLVYGFVAAFTVCIGATMGDGIFLILAFCGLNAIASNPVFISCLGLLGSCVLLYLGWSNIRSNTKIEKIANINAKKGIISNLLLGFSLALVNPLSLVFWIGVFAASMAASDDKSFLPNLFILVGVLIWSLILSTVVTFGKKIVNQKNIHIISTISGLLLLGYGFRFAYLSVKTIFAA